MIQQIIPRLSELSHFGKTLSDIKNSAELYESIFELCFKTFKCDETAVYLADSSNTSLSFAAGKGIIPGSPIPIGQDIKGIAFQTGTVQVAIDAFSDNDNKSPLSEAVIPLRHGKDIIGVVDLISHSKQFQEIDIPLFEIVSGIIAAGIGTVKLKETLNDRIRKLSAVAKAVRALGASDASKTRMDKIAFFAMEALSSEGCEILLVDENSDDLVQAASAGQKARIAGEDISKNNGIIGSALSTQRPSIIPPSSEKAAPKTDEYLSEMAVPLVSKNGASGVLHLFHCKKGIFDETDLLYASIFADLASQSALAVRHTSQISEDE